MRLRTSDLDSTRPARGVDDPAGTAARADAVEAHAEGAHAGEAGPPRPRRGALTRSQVWWLVGITVVAAVVRLVWLSYAAVEAPVWFLPSGDSFSYWYYGNQIADGHGVVSFQTGEATAYYPIGFPALLGGLYWLGEHTPFVDPDLMLLTCVFQVILSVATVVLTFVIGRRLIGPRVGLVAAGVMALFPNLVMRGTTILVETTFIFLVVAAIAVLVDHDWTTGPPSRGRLVAFGAVLSASALVRPFSAPMLLGLLLALLALGIGWRRAALGAAIPVAVLVIAFAPWTIRNAVRLDAFVPSSTNMGDTLCIDRGEDATGGFRWTTHDGCADPDLPEAERNRANTEMAIEFVVEHPDRELVQIVRRARLMFAEDHDGLVGTEGQGSGQIFTDDGRRLIGGTSDWYFRVVLVLSVIGLPLLIRRAPRPERRIVVTTLVGLLVIPLLLWGTPRFHEPLAPFMALAAATLVVAAADRLRGRRAG